MMTANKPHFQLLEDSFPGIAANIVRCESLGFPWTSRPFLKEENGEILAHVGLLEYPMLMDSQRCKVAALHAVCTKETHRGQGLASELIQEALKWSKNRFDSVILFTEIPKFYEKFSFCPIQEYRFRLSCRHDRGTQALRPVISPQDDVLFHQIFRERAPVSNRVWVEDYGSVASFNTLFATYPIYWSLHYSQSLNAFFSFHVKDNALHLYDIIANKIPSLDLILDHMSVAFEEIYFYFSPDRLTSEATPEPYLYDNGHLMVYGNWPQVPPFMISPLSRC